MVGATFLWPVLRLFNWLVVFNFISIFHCQIVSRYIMLAEVEEW